MHVKTAVLKLLLSHSAEKQLFMHVQYQIQALFLCLIKRYESSYGSSLRREILTRLSWYLQFYLVAIRHDRLNTDWRLGNSVWWISYITKYYKHIKYDVLEIQQVKTYTTINLH